MTEYEESPLPIPPGTLLADRFRVVRRLGFGGMGSVYEVEHELTKHRRALKLMHPAFALRPEHVARFLREASAAGRIGNPHIAETFDAGKLDNGAPYIVMELLEGQALNDLIEQRGQLGFPEAISFTLQAAEGVEAAHTAGIVHRDLKPENVFVCSGRVPFVKILDFGISKFDPEKTGDSRLTVDGTTMGTPTHMSPEQIRGQPDIDARTDVYAMGLVLYESVTGRKAYNAETLTQLAVMIHEGKYAPVSQFRADVPPGFEEVIARALDANRDTRYQNMRAFVEALGQFVNWSQAPNLAAAELPPVRATSAPPVAGATESLVPGGAATDAGVEKAPAGTRGTRNTALVVFAGLVVLAVGVVVLTRFLAPSGEPSAAAGSETALEPAPAASSPRAPSVVPAVAPSEASEAVEAPALSQDPAKPTSRAPAAVTRPVPDARPVTGAAASAAPAVEKPKPAKTRAGNVGLAEENPF